MKLTFSYWGNYTIAFKTFFEKLGAEVISPQRTSQRTIKLGVDSSPELFCYPLKINIGNYLEAIEKGADTIVMVTNIIGSCRLRYYGRVEEKILKDKGLDVDFILFCVRPKEAYLQIKKISNNASIFKILKAALFAFNKLLLIEKLEKMGQYFRAREKEKGKTDEILNWAFLKLEKTKNFSELRRLKKEIKEKFKEIKVEKKDVPRVGIIGEFFTVSDPSVNFEIEKKLGREGIEVHREMGPLYLLKKAVFPWVDKKIKTKTKNYLEYPVGGHGQDAVCEMLEYVEKDFDGIIHLLPLSCMPEVTIRPILEKIHKVSKIPFLSISLDGHVAETGINTRIEAFCDVVKNYYNKKHKIWKHF
jgi:predicted nucleotide-binding protein (sugar kinase/HSP70/actin superfamily)